MAVDVPIRSLFLSAYEANCRLWLRHFLNLFFDILNYIHVVLLAQNLSLIFDAVEITNMSAVRERILYLVNETP